MSTSALDSAFSGLRLAQQQLQVVSTNIANVSTPGYTRKILPQTARVAGDIAIGVQAEPIVRKIDVSLTRDLWTQISSVSALDTRIRYLEEIQKFHGSADAGTSISAKIADLKNAFSALSDEPNSASLLADAVTQAGDMVEKFHDFSDLLNRMRNDTEDEISQVVTNVNSLLAQVADLNKQIKASIGIGRSTAALEDARDNAIGQLAEQIDVSFFQRGDGVVVVQTRSGVQLVDETAEELFFQQSNIGTDQYYPANINGIYLGGDPTTNPLAVDMIPYGLGSRIGALVELRDTTLPTYQTQLDEAAFRLAQRFDNEGLRLFTDADGGLPADTAPVPNPPGPLTPVDYVDFARQIRVNQDVIDDPSLLQRGTEGDTIQTGSNEVIRRIIDYTFGTTEYEAVEGSRDIRVSANPAGDTLQENMGLYSSNLRTGDKNLTTYTTDLNIASGNPYNPTAAPAPTNDNFTLRFYDTRTGADSGTITIDLTTAATNFPIGGADLATTGTIDNAGEQLVDYINSLVWPASLNVSASLNTYGQLVLSSRGDMVIGNGDMGDDGLEFMGLRAGTYTTTDPWFDVTVGNADPVRITIEPGDDQTDLVNKIAAVPGINSADVVIDANGHLSFHAERGGDITLSGGPFTSAAGFSTAGGLPILQEIFGSANPLVAHGHPAFRNTNLGPGVNLGTGIVSATSLVDFVQKLVNRQSQDIASAQSNQSDESTYQTTLEKELQGRVGVNIDEELAHMITIQTAYSAAARAVSAISDMFDELLQVI